MTREEAIQYLQPIADSAHMKRYAEALGVAIAALREQGNCCKNGNSSWISVEDRLPERFQPVIVCRKKNKGQYIVEHGHRDVNDWWKVYGTRTKSITHWMPLPAPPKEDEK